MVFRANMCVWLVAALVAGACGQRVRFAAPDFRDAATVLPDGSFSTLSLGQLTADDHWALLVFFPASFTFVWWVVCLFHSSSSSSFLLLLLTPASLLVSWPRFLQSHRAAGL